MDILYWTSKNSDVVLGNTSKIYFKKYVCMLRMFCPAGRVITDTTESPDFSSAIENRKKYCRDLNYAGSWVSRNNKSLHLANRDQLQFLHSLLRNEKDIKVRVEEPWVQLYADSEQRLKEIIDRCPPTCHRRILNVYVPKNIHEETMLRENKILRKSRRNNYRYKVVCRDQRLDTKTKIGLLNYLDNLGDQVFFPKGVRSMLMSPFTGFWGVYFYTNDLSINSFIELISPGTISNIHEIVTVE